MKGLCAERHNNAMTQRQGPTVWWCGVGVGEGAKHVSAADIFNSDTKKG